MIDSIKEIWQTLRTNKLRTLLTGLSVAWGIFMLILLLSISNGVINSAKDNAETKDYYRISVWEGTTSLPYKGFKEGRRISLNIKDLDALKECFPGKITKVTAQTWLKGQISTNRDYLSETGCNGMYPSTVSTYYKIILGRAINDADINSYRKVIMLPQQAADVLFGDYTKSIGKSVNVGDYAFTVIGIYESQGDNTPIVPFTTAYALSGYSNDISSIDVHFTGVTNATESAEIERRVIESLAKSENFDPNDKSAIYTYDRFAGQVQQSQALNILNRVMWTIGLLTLITGIVGVSNIMFVSVRERTHEIGIRRAIGAKPRNILSQIIFESIALTTVFGYIGIVMGTLCTEIVKKIFEGSKFMLNASVDLSIVFEVTLALIIAGAIAGTFPAMRAIKIRPVEALHDE